MIHVLFFKNVNILTNIVISLVCLCIILGVCVDIDPECTSYTQSGFCDDGAVGYSQDYLTQNCKQTCGLCNE